MAIEINYRMSHTGHAFHMAPKGYEYKCIRGPVGCLPADTEVMTPNGWIRISDWNGEPILQWDSESQTTKFLKPKKFIKAPCFGFLNFDCGKHFQMRVTGNHRVPLFDWKGKFVVKSAAEVFARPSKNTVPATWGGVWDGVNQELSEDEIRLWVAICADGHYPKAGKQCEFGLRKERKIDRLKTLLSRMGIDYKISVETRKNGAVETRIRFDRPQTPKHFDWRLSKLRKHDAWAFVDELKHWDGLYDSGYDRYDTTVKQNADIVQYVSHCAGRNATISKFKDRRNDAWAEVYTVHIAKERSPRNKVQIRCDSLKKSVVASKDGCQYCFETDTGFFVVRQFGHVFITGNSGKSVACCWDIFFKSQEQTPCWVTENGVRKHLRWSKWLIGRHSYPALLATTIETWMQWFPQTDFHMSTPISGRLEIPSTKNDGTITRIDLVFYAFESKNIRNDLMSLEISGAWINEATQISWKLIDEMHGRIGRFNPVPGVKLDSFGVIMDTNSPDETNWWYKKEMVDQPQGMMFFTQPPALLKKKREDGTIEFVNNDGRDFKEFGIRPAENVENLKEGFYYWHKQTVGADPDKVKRLILNEFGTSVEGKPVYPEWNDSIHTTKKPIQFQRGMTLLMGSDFGRTPATVIAQLGTNGVFYGMKEITADNMSAEEFIETLLMPELVNKYGFPNCPHINFGDPAGQNYNEVVSVSAIETFNRYGIRTIPAPGLKNNDFNIRIDAVSKLLRKSYKGVAALQISAEGCPMLRKGFNGYYCYRKLNASVEGDERYTAEADKNKFSHVHDAFQYLCVGVFESGIDYSIPTADMRMRQRSVSSEDFSSDFSLV